MTLWLTIVLGGVLTFAIRYSFIGVLAQRSIPRWAADALRLVPVAALSALIAADLATPAPGGAWSARLGGAVVAILIAAWTRSVGWAVLGGAAGFFVIRGWL